METLGVYVQVPFCASKCSFCNFSSRVAHPQAFASYCRALQQEIEGLPESYDAHGIDRRLLEVSVDTVYIGGGTPSLFGATLLEEILACLRRRFHVADSIEFTLEVTPGSADEDFLRRANALGLNRLSIGAQSFEDRELRAVGRLHSSDDTRSLVQRARRSGFQNSSLDLIIGLPHQTSNSWEASLRAAAELRPEHLSVYLFELDEKSRLGREVLEQGGRYHAAEVPSEEFMAQGYETARELLIQAGYVQYEISNFALPGFESRHNQKYWRLEPYVGVGAGAHSFDGAHRWANESAAEQYQERLSRSASPIAELHSLSPDEQLEEFFFLGLRQCEGIDPESARQRWGAALDRWEPTLSKLARDCWLENRAGRVALPEHAYLVSNEIFQEFLAG